MQNMSFGNVDSDSLMCQAQHVWTMLDEMATSNPEGYREFIKKQLEEGKEQLTPPQPHMCVKTKLLKPKPSTLYINMMGWKKIPPPKKDDDPVSVVGTALQTTKDDSGTFAVVSVAFNSDIVKKFGRHCENPIDRDTLVQLSMDYLEEQQKVKISRTYNVLSEKVTYKGDLKDIQKGFTVKSKASDKKFENELEKLEKKCGPLASGIKDSLLDQLKNIAVGDSQSDSEKADTDQSGITLLPENKPVKSGLIEEIGDTDKLPVPRYELNCLSSDSASDEVLELSIKLPNVCSVAECELDISEDDISMTVPGKYEFYLKLPKTIKENDSSAKFSKKTCNLTIKMPVLR